MRIDGKKIKELRLAKGLTRKHLADMIGMAESGVYSLEHQKYKSTKKLKELCKALECKENVLMCLPDILTTCTYKGCKEKIANTHKYCDEHKKQVNRECVNGHNKRNQDRKGVVKQKVNIPNYATGEIKQEVVLRKKGLIQVHAIENQGGECKGKVLTACDVKEKVKPKGERIYDGFLEVNYLG